MPPSYTFWASYSVVKQTINKHTHKCQYSSPEYATQTEPTGVRTTENVG
jgi:hypothetical protein